MKIETLRLQIEKIKITSIDQKRIQSEVLGLLDMYELDNREAIGPEKVNPFNFIDTTDDGNRDCTMDNYLVLEYKLEDYKK